MGLFSRIFQVQPSSQGKHPALRGDLAHSVPEKKEKYSEFVRQNAGRWLHLYAKRALNSIAAEVLEVAIGEKEGSVQVTYASSQPSIGTIGALRIPIDESDLCCVDVPVVTMREILDTVGDREISLMKMDLEGMDVRILPSLTSHQMERFANVVCEFYEARLVQCNSARAYLASVPWMDRFDLFAVGVLGTNLRIDDLAAFPVKCQTFWLRRKQWK